MSRRAKAARCSPAANRPPASWRADPTTFQKANMKPFVFEACLPRVVFGAGSLARLGAEIEALGARRALVLSTPEQAASAERIAEMLGERAAGVFAGAVMHVPIE